MRLGYGLRVLGVDRLCIMQLLQKFFLGRSGFDTYSVTSNSSAPIIISSSPQDIPAPLYGKPSASTVEWMG